jgi:hypothetical protein
MHEKLLLNIISKKIESLKKRIEIDLPDISTLLLHDRVQVGGYNVNVDCASSLNIYFKNLANSDDEGIELYVHIPKSASHAVSLDIYLIRSSGAAFAMDDFLLDLKAEKATKCKFFNDLYEAIDSYYDLMKKKIQEEYLPKIR